MNAVFVTRPSIVALPGHVTWHVLTMNGLSRTSRTAQHAPPNSFLYG